MKIYHYPTEVFSEALDTQPATKADITPPAGEPKLVKWMPALVIGGISALILKAFF